MTAARRARAHQSPAEALVAHVSQVIAGAAGPVDALVESEVRRALADERERAALTSAVLARLRGLGPLDPLLADPDIDEVIVNGDTIWVERFGRLEQVGRLDHPPVEQLVERVLAPLGRRIDRTSPIVDARLPDGARVCAVVAPVAVGGTALSIRKFPSRIRRLAEFTDPVGVQLCSELIDARCNVLVTGATSSGKTSLLAALIDLLDPDERLLVLEDTAELPLAGRHAVRFEARPASVDGPPPITVADLVRAALRLRPDRLVVGEVRGDEVVGLVQAMNTGHDGSLSTCHANGPLDALLRLESLVMLAAPQWPLAAVREQLRRSLDVVVHVARDRDGCRRVASIHELDGDGVRCLADLSDRRLTRRAPLTRRRRP